MNTKINKVTFKKEYTTDFGTMYLFEVEYEGKKALYSSKNKEQKNFVEGQTIEFEEEEKMGKNGKYLSVKLPKKAWGNTNYARAVKKEQSKYSGFAVSYCKDMIIAGKIELKDWESASEKIFKLMVKLDKSIEND